MEKPDILTVKSSLNGNISCISAITREAHPNNEFEIHSHPGEFEIYYFLEGDLFFAFEGNRINADAGSMIIVADNTLHRPIIKKTCRYIRKRILFKKESLLQSNTAAFELLNRISNQKVIFFSSKTAETLGLYSLFAEVETHLSGGTPYDDFCAYVSLCSLLIKAIGNSKDFCNSNFYASGGKAREIIEYINEHLQDDLSYKRIAEHFYMSEKSLYKFFKKETGFTLSNYINERKIIKARSLLNAGSNASEAAVAAGFNDYSVFYRCFLKKTGITPMEYIKKIEK